MAEGKTWGNNKKKKMSPEQVREITRQQLAPYWYGMPPMVAGIATPAEVILFPLDDQFTSKNWLIAYIDPTQVNRRAVIDFCKEMQRRYEALGVKFLGVLRVQHQAFLNKGAIENLIARRGIKFAVAVDFDGHLGRALGAKEVPMLMFYSSGKKLFERNLKTIETLEVDLQPFLRLKDAGLPLLPPYQASDKIPIPSGSLEFGKRLGGAGLPKETTFTGEWTREDERTLSTDRTATIQFKMLGTGFSLLAQSVSRYSTPANLVVSIHGGPVSNVEAGRDMVYDHEGNSRLKILHFGLYNVLTDVAVGTEVTLQFPDAHTTQIAIYGFRFND